MCMHPGKVPEAGGGGGGGNLVGGALGMFIYMLRCHLGTCGRRNCLFTNMAFVSHPVRDPLRTSMTFFFKENNANTEVSGNTKELEKNPHQLPNNDMGFLKHPESN